MQYELIANSNKGVIIDPTPVLRDIKDTFPVSFVLPDSGAYIAIFRGEDNQERKAVIKDGSVLIPKELITKEQRVGVTVCLTDGETIMHSWECHPLAVGSFLKLRQTQWQITAALSDEELYARIAEIERTQAKTLEEMQTLEATYKELNENITTAAEENAKTLEGLRKELAATTETVRGLLAFANQCKAASPYLTDIPLKED